MRWKAGKDVGVNGRRKEGREEMKELEGRKVGNGSMGREGV